MTTTESFTDEELMAYVDERLHPARAAEVERQVRTAPDLLSRLAKLINSTERGEVTLGGMWRRGRWSCPPRAVWAGFVAGRLGDGLTQYLQFHLETGCRICDASVRDLTNHEDPESGQRIRKIFQSSAGGLRAKD